MGPIRFVISIIDIKYYAILFRIGTFCALLLFTKLLLLMGMNVVHLCFLVNLQISSFSGSGNGLSRSWNVVQTLAVGNANLSNMIMHHKSAILVAPSLQNSSCTHPRYSQAGFFSGLGPGDVIQAFIIMMLTFGVLAANTLLILVINSRRYSKYIHSQVGKTYILSNDLPTQSISVYWYGQVLLEISNISSIRMKKSKSWQTAHWSPFLK